MKLVVGFLLMGSLIGFSTKADVRYIVLQSTTSAHNSGLYDFILPQFTASLGIEVRVVAVGSGQALRNASDCNGEVIVVHDPIAEQAFISTGFAAERIDLMYNNYVIVGPGEDPADIFSAQSTADAFGRIAAGHHAFVSRGDNSGTHSHEKNIWNQVGVMPQPKWHHETGAGMGATLNIAVGMNAYTLTDKATWIQFGNKQNHIILFEGDDDLVNLYSIITVNEERCETINSDDAQIFLNWMISKDGQNAIGDFKTDGFQLFQPVFVHD